MSPKLWALQLKQRKWRQKIFLFFNRTRKRTLFLRLGTIASADCVKPSIILQTLTKNVQEWLKRKGKKVKRS